MGAHQMTLSRDSYTAHTLAREEIEKWRERLFEDWAGEEARIEINVLCDMALEALSARISAVAAPSGPHCEYLPAEPTYEMLKALAGDPVIMAASDEVELRRRYRAMLQASPCPSPIDGDDGTVGDCIKHGNCGCDNRPPESA
jgi:hypothetical protein